MESTRLWRFLGLVFAIGWFFMGLAYAFGFESKGRPWLLLAMWAPLMAALLTSRQTRRELWSRVKRAGWWLWPAALLAGWSSGGAQQLLLAASDQGHWNSNLFRLSASGGAIDSVHHVHVILGAGRQSFTFFALNLLLSLTVGSVITMLIGAIGEETGWRGVLQPELQRRFGPIKGTLLVGLIWGYWHLPANLAGLNDAQHPMLGSLVIFPLLAISMSFVLAWFVNRSGSIWPPALAHGANNTIVACTIVLPGGWFADQWTAAVAAILIGTLFAWLLARDTAGAPHGRAEHLQGV
jgi:membrane protease YdiL (CAAX protease family)